MDERQTEAPAIILLHKAHLHEHFQRQWHGRQLQQRLELADVAGFLGKRRGPGRSAASGAQPTTQQPLYLERSLGLLLLQASRISLLSGLLQNARAVVRPPAAAARLAQLAIPQEHFYY